MLQKNHTGKFQIQCVFQQGTPLREYVILQSEKKHQIAILRISEAVFDFFVSAGIPVCEPVTVPPGSLVGQNLLCIFQADLGAQEPVPFVVVQTETNKEISILQIIEEAYGFFSTIGVPVCLLTNQN